MASIFRTIKSFGLPTRFVWCNERTMWTTQDVIVCGAITNGSRSPLVFIQGTLNNKRYIGQVLEPAYLEDLQDNTRPHTTEVTRLEFLENA
ncbi:hypothetical protein BDFB_004718, partial [Asbolus verrucosus]